MERQVLAERPQVLAGGYVRRWQSPERGARLLQRALHRRHCLPGLPKPVVLPQVEGAGLRSHREVLLYRQHLLCDQPQPQPQPRAPLHPLAAPALHDVSQADLRHQSRQPQNRTHLYHGNRDD